MKEEIGRVCIKLAGREASRKCVIVGVVDKNFVIVTGPKPLTGVKRRRTNICHLAFTPYKLNIDEKASDEEIIKTIEEAGLTDFMKKAGVKLE